MSEVINVEEIFASKVFTRATMKERLPKNVYREVIKVMENGGELSLATADVVAKEMKDWAVENGATHYTHWFQPLTGITAEKHDSFISNPDENGKMLMEFSGKELIKGEPDASSFPSGGLRATFEARGYTAWDITSPAFLKEDATGVILCIPTAFCSYKGEALDKKTPLLRSMEAINVQALRIVRLFKNTEATKVAASVGPEQEYFLVDREKYLKRTDLIFTGRTLFGAPAPKGQELEDHYFGTIRERIGAYMKDLNIELWKLGVTAKTQHNEVAPAQHELASIYETANIAVDHNQLVMETMKKVAGRHGLTCLLHEKPFAGVNGSGKHNNWSLCTDNGVNLLDPGDTPNENVQFLLVLACIIKAVDIHADLLRQSASDVGNDHRLGANEAPPAIISVFLGEQLEDVVKQLVETGEAAHVLKGGKLETGVSTLPDFTKDATDRNRTSPFAFTGNKFEFRMVGSADSIGSPNTILNAIVAEAFCEAADILEKADDFDLAVHDLIKEYLTKHQRIIFNGNGYSDEWVKEAERRGLPNIKSMVEAVDTLTTDKAVKLFEKFGIFTKAELESREEILYETYTKTINIEALTMIDMASKQIIPAVIRYTKSLADTVIAVREAGADASASAELLKTVSEKLSAMKSGLKKLEDALAKAGEVSNVKEQAFYYKDVVKTAMDELRAPADEVEMMVDKKIWPIPTYGDLIFEV
ncbi:glutamine synthetase type III [Parablautia intestinalis]|jgi:glutamine synthetase|uniref:Glutamine synthetase type III n=1 Tax=Parablautia intestinalis TaxID=2320100 RepID=A0A3A9AKL7_9FIRM|nr:glutamine synthetase III [Parablautia intestinalis]MCI8615278.1 glutamine synthetase type III [Lachnospiraceae bacterium]MDE7046655.1 glutamine synthetase III [Lachnospiraceae bacterium]RKI91927.1 glutamine synthetase type III [Parablautia intestinalis]